MTDFQKAVAEFFFGLVESKDFVVAGGAALLASDLIQRPTQDLDLFASGPTTSVGPAKSAFVQVLSEAGIDVTEVFAQATFCRLKLEVGNQQTLVDLAIDSPPLTLPKITVLGPTLAPAELAGRKLLALFSRAEARDFADVFVLTRRFSKTEMIDQASLIDPGFDLPVLAQMFQGIHRFDPGEIALPGVEIPDVFEFFENWRNELAN